MRSIRTKNYTLVCGDCLDWLPARTANSIHAVVTDPPYGLLEYSEKQLKNRRKGNGIWRLPNRRDGAERQPTPRYTVLTLQDRVKLGAFVLRAAADLHRVLVPGAHVFWATHPLFSHIVSTAFSDVGFEKRGEIIRTVSTLRGGERPKGAHEAYPEVCVLPKGAWEPWVLFRKPLKGRIRDNLKKYGTGGLRRKSTEEPFRDLIRSSTTSKSERALAPHPSLKPQAFMRQIVWAALPLGKGIILDPFMGAGSTIAAAANLGLRSIGIERNLEYFKMAHKAIPPLARLRSSGDTILNSSAS